MRHGKLRDSFMGPAIYCEGEEHVEAAWEAKTAATRASRARRGLEADLDNIDAYVLLAMHAKTLAEAIALYREAVRVGDRLWAPALEDPEMVWWGFVGTRPYMRAMQNLALALEAAGDFDEAEAIYRRLLEMNPNDNQGIRCLLIERLMARPRIGELRALVAQYPGDAMLDTAMAELWLGLRSKKADVAALVAAVGEVNEHVLPFLLNGVPEGIEMSEWGLTMGGEDEAAEYVERYAPIWARSGAALERLRAHVGAAG